MPAVPKPPKMTAEQRHNERRKRPRNPLKPVFDEHTRVVQAREKDKGKFQVDGSTLRPISPKRLAKLEAQGQSLTSTFNRVEIRARLSGARRIVKTANRIGRRRKHEPKFGPKGQTKLRQVGARARRWAAPLVEWRRKIRATWGGCIITGEDRPGRTECHHCYDKAIRPQWIVEPWNGIVLEKYVIHRLADEYPEFHKALISVADEARAAEEGRRPPVTRGEAREIIFRMAPEMRRYARQEG